MNEETTARLDPPWREAVRRILESPHEPGTLLRHEWLHAVMGLKLPTPETSWVEAQATRHRYRNQIHETRYALLTTHSIDLLSREGIGYEVLAPGQQARVAMDHFQKVVVSAFDRVALRTEFVDEGALTDAELKELADTRSRLSRLRQMTAKTIPLLEDK